MLFRSALLSLTLLCLACTPGYVVRHSVDEFEGSQRWWLGKKQYASAESTLSTVQYFKGFQFKEKDGRTTTGIRLELERPDLFYYFPESFEYKLLLDGEVFTGEAHSGDDFRRQMVFKQVTASALETAGYTSVQEVINLLRAGASRNDLQGIRSAFGIVTYENVHCEFSAAALEKLVKASSIKVRLEGKNDTLDVSAPAAFVMDLKRFVAERAAESPPQ